MAKARCAAVSVGEIVIDGGIAAAANDGVPRNAGENMAAASRFVRAAAAVIAPVPPFAIGTTR